MSTSVINAGYNYIVEDAQLKEVFEHLAVMGEYARCRDNGDGTHSLYAEAWDDMLCGNVSYSFANIAGEFIRAYCLPFSYACFYEEENRYYAMAWKDADGETWIENRQPVNPFASEIEKLERKEDK